MRLMPGGEFQLRQEIVRVGRLMYDKGLISAGEGNISVRLDRERILITPSGLHKGLLNKSDLLIVDAEGKPVRSVTTSAGSLKPTSELPMHLEVYRRRPDVLAVVHAHPPITVALSIAGIPMADCLLPEVIVLLGLIPTTQYATPSSIENAQAIRRLIQHHDAIVLQRHGALTVGDSLMQAFMRLETVEQNARIGFMLAQLGSHEPLPADEVIKLLKQREDMGLCRPGDAQDFCQVCGVCHRGSDHAPTMRPGQINTLQAGDRLTGVVSPQMLPPISQPAADPAALRELVAQAVRKTLGSD
jgi:L-fuculose-phosphate aldolase